MSIFTLEIIVNLVFLSLASVLTLLLAYGLYAFYSGAPFVPTPRKTIVRMLALAELRPGESALDLGSGDGRIVLAAARQTASPCVGIEINPVLHLLAKIKARLKRNRNAEFIRTDLWNYNLEKTDVLFLYFIAHKMEKMREKIKREMKPGSRVISHGFQFSDWPYLKKDDTIYLYIV